jgi:uncharacterized protein (TIGR00369 family)
MSIPLHSRRVEIEWADPDALLRVAREQDGLSFLRAIATGELPPPPIGRLLGFRLSAADAGRVVFECEPGERHYNPLLVVHGGLAATLCDSAMACAVQTLLPAGEGATTLELKINYVRAMTAEVGRVRAVGTVIHLGRTTATAEARVLADDDTLYAHATTTCLILR